MAEGLLLLNSTGVIGQILSAGTENLTGSDPLTFALLVMFLFCIGILFGMPIEFTIVFLLPLILASALIDTAFAIALIVVLVLFLAMILTKNFLFKG